MNASTNTPGRAKNYGLWTLQLLLALLFLFAGGTKLVVPLDVLASMGSPNQVQLPGAFIRFVGVAEVLGALGLVLPGLLGVRRELTPVAGAGLIIIMIGATILTIASGEYVPEMVQSAVPTSSPSSTSAVPESTRACRARR